MLRSSKFILKLSEERLPFVTKVDGRNADNHNFTALLTVKSRQLHTPWGNRFTSTRMYAETVSSSIFLEAKHPA
jgi:hypothetical protein